MARQKYAPELIAKAKKLYMEYKTIAEVARQTYISRSTINYYIAKSWEKERKAREDLNLARLNDITAMDLKTIGKDSITILKRAINNSATGDEPPSLKDALAVSKIIETIKKLNDEVQKKEEEEKEKIALSKIKLDSIDPLEGK